MTSTWKFGHLIEGVVVRDPMTDRYVIQTTDHTGKEVIFDPLTALAELEGQEVRFTLASFEALSRLAKLVEEKGGGQVEGLYPPKR